MTEFPNDQAYRGVPPLVVEAEALARSVDFPLSCTRQTGAMLRVMAASKPGGRLLEFGTGVGVGAAWILDGMSQDSHLDTIEVHPEACELSRQVLGADPRVTVHEAHSRDWVRGHSEERFDLIFVDAGVPKFFQREITVSLLAPGGWLIGDDLLPQDKWVESHPQHVDEFRRTIFDDERIVTILLDWGTGMSLSVRR